MYTNNNKELQTDKKVKELTEKKDYDDIGMLWEINQKNKLLGYLKTVTNKY